MPVEVSICATGTGGAEESSGSRYSSQVPLLLWAVFIAADSASMIGQAITASQSVI